MQQTYELNNGALELENPIDQLLEFVLYPNPSANYFQISGIKNNAFIAIFDVDGKVVFETTSRNRQQIFLPNLPSRLYFVKIEEAERKLTSKLIIK